MRLIDIRNRNLDYADYVCPRACVRVCVRACVCVRMCVRACVRACRVCVYVRVRARSWGEWEVRVCDDLELLRHCMNSIVGCALMYEVERQLKFPTEMNKA